MHNPATLSVMADVGLERERQIAKGYDAAHDDKHLFGLMAAQAAFAIMPPAYYELAAQAFEARAAMRPSWIDLTQSRELVLIQGIALAVAEVERIRRHELIDIDLRTRISAALDATRARLCRRCSGRMRFAATRHMGSGCSKTRSARGARQLPSFRSRVVAHWR